jgi:polyisoprenoid-binding protein YceI
MAYLTVAAGRWTVDAAHPSRSFDRIDYNALLATGDRGKFIRLEGELNDSDPRYTETSRR